MSHTYDSGLAAPQRTLLQAKVIDLLKPLTISTLGLGGEAAGFLEGLVELAYPVEANDLDSIDMLMEDTRGKAPVVTVAPLDLRPDQAGGPAKSVGKLGLQLNFVHRHRRGRMLGRATSDAIAAADDKADPGVFAALELVWARLFDQPLSIPTLHELKMLDEHHLITGKDWTIWQQNWALLVTRDANLARGITQKFTLAVTTLVATDDVDEQRPIVENSVIG